MATGGRSGLGPKQKRKIKRFLGWMDEQQRKMGNVSRKRNGSRGVPQDREVHHPKRSDTDSKTTVND